MSAFDKSTFLYRNYLGSLWALMILVLCGLPGSDLPHISFLEMLSFDKWVHTFLFFVLTCLFVRGFGLQTQILFLKNYSKLTASVFCILYGGWLELMQGWVFEDRSADLYDFCANTFGVLIGNLLFDKLNLRILPKIIPV